MVYAATIGGLSVSSDGGATFVNRTTANGLGNNRVKAVIAEIQTTVDLQISISESSDPVVAGSNGGNDNLVHTITVTNNGPATATNIVIQFGANTTTAPTLAFQMAVMDRVAMSGVFPASLWGTR
ncbi:MAG: hypothetical protein H6629_17965 [Calditrichae bacterium]|nr:hypothetical protein [Calditrichia bacterium]